MNELIYVYCISNRLPDLSLSKEHNYLKYIMHNNIFAVIKYVSESEFSDENLKKNLTDMDWLESRVREHVEVINLLMEQNTVIPFNFASIFQSENNLIKFITDYSDSLIENFSHVEGKEEWAVKIYCNRKALCEQIDELSEDAAALEKQIMASSPGKAFLLKRKKTDLIENEMDRLCKVFGQKYYDTFRLLSDATYLNNILPQDVTERDDTMILNAAFLVKKTKVSDLKRAVEELRKKDGNSGFVIETTGPWAPFSFIYLKEKS